MTDKVTDLLATDKESICVFCGSSSVVAAHYTDLATQTGADLAKAGFRLVYGGGGVGLMGAVARAAHEAQGDVIGIIPEFLQTREVVYKDVPHIVVDDMHERKAMMYEAADAFLVLPGGLGTMEEVVEVISWLRMDLHSKPIVFLDEDDYWTPLVSLIQHTVEAKFTPGWVNDYIFKVSDPLSALNIISREIGPRERHELERKIPADKV